MMQRRQDQLNCRWFARIGMSLGLITFLVAGLLICFIAPSQGAVMITIATDPPEATVQINGMTIGQSPLSTIVPEGEHDLIVFKAGYKLIDRKIFADPSAPAESNRYAFGLLPTGETLSAAERSRRARSLEQRAEESFKRGDYVAPEYDNAWYYLNKLQELDSSNPFISEMRQRIRRVLKQQAEMSHRHNDLG